MTFDDKAGIVPEAAGAASAAASTAEGNTAGEPMIMPVSFSVDDEHRPIKSRAVFSSSVAGIDSHHARQTSVTVGRTRRRKVTDDSLRLIDDLTNRPMDPMFSDARLGAHRQSSLTVWITRVIVFVICIGVGFYSCLFIQKLNTDPRKIVRQSLAADLTAQNTRLDALVKEVGGLRSEVEQRSKTLADATEDSQLVQDEMSAGLLPVSGPGITLTLADPIAAGDGSADGSYHRDNGVERLRVITDLDLQLWVSLLWQSGAEAIAINGNRIGVQTSVRTAGSTIMVDVNPVQSPYRIEAIGDSGALAGAVGADRQKTLYDSFKEAGIYPQISVNSNITMGAATSGDLTFARKGE